MFPIFETSATGLVKLMLSFPHAKFGIVMRQEEPFQDNESIESTDSTYKPATDATLKSPQQGKTTNHLLMGLFLTTFFLHALSGL